MTPVSASRNSSPPRNRLLAALSPADLALLQPHFQSVAMPLLKDLERPNRRIEAVYFLDNGIASVVAVQPDETRIEVGLIGREGLSGIAVVLGGDQSPHATYIQVAGEGQRITAENLRHAMSESETLHGLLLKFVQVFMVQTAHTAIANARAHIDRRLARWILMAHDRTGDNSTAAHARIPGANAGRETSRGHRSNTKSQAAEIDPIPAEMRSRYSIANSSNGWPAIPTACPRRNIGVL